ncbi:hypothetical protein LSAT2_020617 [Lamellibrachia satsuma]|nr:hypothetical protein LSAT2_020617 [Lamellibrachia satsuma]
MFTSWSVSLRGHHLGSRLWSLMMDTTSYREHEDDSGIESSAADSGDNAIYIKIGMPETKLTRCLQFSPDDSVWTAKQQVLVTLGKDLKDGLNYGLYSPPANGKAGKFLDEERMLKDYPLPGPIGYLEFKYKRRVYKLMQVNPRKLKQLNCKANLKQFMEFVRKGDMEKMTKMLKKGLDPNFQDHETGEIPLTLATTITKCRNVIITLVGGGAHLDFRNRSGMTGMHRAAVRGNCDALKILLELGASPNYKDGHGLTPLYYSVSNDADPKCVEMLLYDHAVIGTADDHSWSEVHQACKSSCVQNLEHLLFYGADMNVQNSSGNTPLHVAALNNQVYHLITPLHLAALSNQESCVRVLLFRGADRTVLNYAHKDAFDSAIISGNIELAHIIRTFRQEDVVPFQEMPTYNEKRRHPSCITGNMLRCRSNQSLNLLFYGSKSPSPAVSNLCLAQYSSNGNLFESESLGQYDSDSPRSMSISSGAGSCSGYYMSDSTPPFRRAWSAENLLNVSEQGHGRGREADIRIPPQHIHQVPIHNQGGTSSLHDGSPGTGKPEIAGEG